jgi:hypothetical protein
MGQLPVYKSQEKIVEQNFEEYNLFRRKLSELIFLE